MNEQLEQDLLPSFLHDRYRVEAILAEHRLGLVIQAIDTRLKRAVAIRCLRADPGMADQDDFRACKDRCSQEIEAAARIGFHTTIVPVLDFIVGDDGTQFLVIEYLPGGSLEARLQQGSLPIAAALRVTIDAADALAAAHAAGVIHRDIRPGTLFLTANGRAKVGGFGLAQIEAQESRTRALLLRLGTPLYMSPEQEAYLHPATDQYSLGLVLFEMVTGVTYKQIGAPEVEDLLGREIPALAALITRMVAKYPDDRFESLGDVAEAANAALRQVERHATEPDEPRAAEPGPAHEPSDPADGPRSLPHLDGDSAMANAWAVTDRPASSDTPAVGRLDPPEPMRPTTTSEASGKKLVVEIGLLALLFCAIVGTFVAHYWIRLF